MYFKSKENMIIGFLSRNSEVPQSYLKHITFRRKMNPYRYCGEQIPIFCVEINDGKCKMTCLREVKGN